MGSESSSSGEEVIPAPVPLVQRRAADAYLRILPTGFEPPSGLTLGIDKIALCGQAKYESKLYCGQRPSGRCRVYKKEHKIEAKETSKKTHLLVLQEDAARNSAVMATSVAICGGLGSIGWVAGPVGGAPGTALGIATGLCLGGYLIHKHVNKKIKLAIQVSDHFVEWRTKAIAEKVYPLFRNFIDADIEFKDLFCPLSHDICSIPMLAPDGFTYNRKQIYEYISYGATKDDEKVRSPMKEGVVFCKNDLVVNAQYCRKLIEKSEKAYIDVIKYGHDSAIVHGMGAVVRNTRELMESIRQQLATHLHRGYENAVRRDDMTDKKRSKIIHKATRQWDFREIVTSNQVDSEIGIIATPEPAL